MDLIATYSGADLYRSNNLADSCEVFNKYSTREQLGILETSEIFDGRWSEMCSMYLGLVY